MAVSVKVSVIIPVYKIAGDYIRKCVETLEQQTVSEIEIILVDDGTPDDGGAVCDSLAEQFGNCSVIHQKNQGVSAARNAGMQKASGTWLMFADPDDYSEPDLIEKLLNLCDEETDIACCCCKVLTEQGMKTDLFFEKDRIFSTEAEKKGLYFQLMDSVYGQPNFPYTAIGVPWGKLYRKDFLMQKHIFFDPALRRMQDNMLNMYAFAAARKITYGNFPLYIYRYEHIQGYQIKYNPNHLPVNLCIIQKRAECIKKLGLQQDASVYDAFLYEAFTKLKVALRYGPLHQAYPDSRAKQKQEAEQLLQRPEIQQIMQDLKQRNVLSKTSDKLIFHFMQMHFWGALQLLWKFRKNTGG